MPWKSKAQRGYMHVHHPEIAARWDAHTPKGAKLPEHVGKQNRKPAGAGGGGQFGGYAPTPLLRTSRLRSELSG